MEGGGSKTLVRVITISTIFTSQPPLLMYLERLPIKYLEIEMITILITENEEIFLAEHDFYSN